MTLNNFKCNLMPLHFKGLTRVAACCMLEGDDDVNVVNVVNIAESFAYWLCIYVGMYVSMCVFVL